jgi:hypothetical protein
VPDLIEKGNKATARLKKGLNRINNGIPNAVGRRLTTDDDTRVASLVARRSSNQKKILQF